MQALTELKQRGVRDILICCVDGLKGFPEAIEAIFPATTVQTFIVHLIRQNLRYVPRRQYDAVVKELWPIYTAINAQEAERPLKAFDQKWGGRLPVITQVWRDNWDYVTPYCPSDRTSAASSTRQTRSTRSTGNSERRSRPRATSRPRTPSETALPRHPQPRPAMDHNPRVDESTPGVQNPLRRPPTRLTAYPVSWTPSTFLV